MRQKSIANVISYEQFEVFIMVYAAYADFKEMPLEKSFIIRKFGEQRYQSALDLYNSIPEYERVQIIVDHLDVFKNQNKKKQIISDIKTLLDFDGLNRFEQTFYDYLKTIIHHIA